MESFMDFIKLAIEAITLVNGVLSLRTMLNDHYSEFSKSEWLKFCKYFKKYIIEHPECEIEIVETEKKTTMYKHK